MSTWVPRDWCPSIIRSLRSTQLERLVFCYRVSATTLLPFTECAPLLNKLPFPTLTSVCFINRAPWNVKRERQEITDHLPNLAVRGILDYRAEPEGMAKGFPWGHFIHNSQSTTFNSYF